MNFDHLSQILKENQMLAAFLGMGGAGILTFWLKDIPNKIYHILRREFSTELIITSQNAIFHELLRWIEHRYANKNFRRLKLTNGMWGSRAETTTSIGYGVHFIRYGRMFLWVNMSKEANSSSPYDKEMIVITKLGRSRKLFDILTEEVRTLEDRSDRTKIYKMESEWMHARDQNKRDIKSIFIEKEKKDLLLSRLSQFIGSEQWYQDNGIPYQLGILLYGAPGTGKTSLIKAVAGYLDYPIYYLSAQKLSSIEKAMSSLPDKCVIVIEDIDANFLTHSRDKEHDKGEESNIFEGLSVVSLSEVLNALDGMFSAHGRILIATTNHIETLDSALIRPGRIDIRLEIGFVNNEILQLFIDNFFPNTSISDEKLQHTKITKEISIATLQNMILQGKSDVEIFDYVTE